MRRTKRIYRKCLSRQIETKHACEVGVYLPQTSNIIDFIHDGVRSTLVEPDPRSLRAIQEYFGETKNITVFSVAVFDHDGTVELVQRNASTFVSSLPSSPAVVNDRYEVAEGDKFSVECRTFDKIDDGTIDLLSVDIEGSEWYVIKHMRSRPKVVSLETHGKKYVNPFIDEINRWMAGNGYSIWYKDNTDTVFARGDTVMISFLERGGLVIRNAVINFNKYKRTLKDRFITRSRAKQPG
ncbi:MAG TPA: FkbM family methyltransferase [Candidatus Kryptobacter bacterium]|nr:FkbM family methyltransferase [Candidatus Kryptobacter bacterium]